MSPDRFEEQLAALAAKMAPAVQQAQDAELSEELLLQYYAGTLSKEEAEKVGRMAALSPQASAYLAQLELDAEEAAERTDRRSVWARVLGVMPGMSAMPGFVSSLSGVQTLSLATGAMAAILALVIVVPPMLQGPPDFGGSPYVVALGQGKNVETLPGGELIGDVVTDWTLHMPIGGVDELKWFVWQPVEGAATYDLSVIAPDGRVIHASSTDDTHAKLSSEEWSNLARGQECAWVVEALDTDSQLLARGVGRFTLEN